MLIQTDYSHPHEAVVHDPNEPERDSLGIALIGPNGWYQDQALRHLTLTLHVVRQIPYYPPLDQVSVLAILGHDVVIIDLDSDTEVALKLVEGFGKIANVVVMAIANNPSKELVIRSMQAGAREILSVPLTREQLDEAMTRARKYIFKAAEQARGRLCIFVGAKGGAGTTTIASNFALAAAIASEKSTLLIDLDLPLGDAVLNFGIHPGFSTKDALENYERLDGTLLKYYATTHESGLSILAAPGRYVPCEIKKDAVDKLLQVARQEYACVVVDAGTQFEIAETAIFHGDAKIYLVSQTSIADLRNSNRIISLFGCGTGACDAQVVLNRDSSASRIDDEQVTKAITRTAEWRVPNDFKAVREMQRSGRPLVLKDSPICESIRRMARAALELPEEPEGKRKKVLGLF
jgi:pilus assembly protein CpaE